MISYSEMLKRPKPPPGSKAHVQTVTVPEKDNKADIGEKLDDDVIDKTKKTPGILHLNASPTTEETQKKKRNKKKPSKYLPSFSDFIVTPVAKPTPPPNKQVEEKPMGNKKSPRKADKSQLAKDEKSPVNAIKQNVKSKSAEKKSDDRMAVGVSGLETQDIVKHKGKKVSLNPKVKHTKLKKVILRERGILPPPGCTNDSEASSLNVDNSKSEGHSTAASSSPVDNNGVEIIDKDLSDRVEEEIEEDRTESLPSPSKIDEQLENDEEDSKNDILSTDSKNRANSPEPPPFSRKFRSYCTNVITDELNDAVASWLTEVKRFHDRLYAKDKRKARIKKRLVCGMREVKKEIELGNVKVVVIVPNVMKIKAEGGLDSQIMEMKRLCEESSLPVIYAMSKSRLGYVVKKGSVACVAVINYEGAEHLYKRVQEELDIAREKLAERIAKLNASVETSPQPPVATSVEEDLKTELDQLQVGSSHESDSTDGGLSPVARSTSHTSMASFINAPEFVPRSQQQQQSPNLFPLTRFPNFTARPPFGMYHHPPPPPMQYALPPYHMYPHPNPPFALPGQTMSQIVPSSHLPVSFVQAEYQSKQ